mgnify:CR=1 FL=1|jgi:hypothetical protein|tara:strand:- start:66 stop:179 length:114 start_codon:yes stop_codon:yes gene_type:complete
MKNKIKTPSWWVTTSKIEKIVVAVTLLILGYLIVIAL